MLLDTRIYQGRERLATSEAESVSRRIARTAACTWAFELGSVLAAELHFILIFVVTFRAAHEESL